MGGRRLAPPPVLVSLNGVRTTRLSAPWPDRLLAWAYVRRAAAFWGSLHVFLWIVSGATVTALEPLPALAMVAMAGGLGVFDAKKRHELLFLRNLGVRPAMVAAVWLGTATLLEMSMHVAMGFFQ